MLSPLSQFFFNKICWIESVSQSHNLEKTIVIFFSTFIIIIIILLYVRDDHKFIVYY